MAGTAAAAGTVGAVGTADNCSADDLDHHVTSAFASYYLHREGTQKQWTLQSQKREGLAP